MKGPKMSSMPHCEGGHTGTCHPIFRAISSKIVVVPTQYFSPIKCVPTQYLRPSYGPGNMNLNNYFNLHVCLSIRGSVIPSVRPSVRPSEN